MNDISVTVVIPTRNRVGTLKYCLDTCVNQDYQNLQILVSDNYSQDATADVVESFDDPRITYIRTSAPLAMSDNWEFSFQHVKTDFVTFIGDDDGLLPGAITDIVSLLGTFGGDAVCWKKAEYHWPDHPLKELRNQLHIPVFNRLIRVATASAMRDAGRFLLPYNKLPCVYNSMVSVQSMRKVVDETGRFFHCVTPDVYSGFVLLPQMESYLYSSRPFSVNGASGMSNGTAFSKNDEVGADWLPVDDNSPISVHKTAPLIPGSIYSTVLEAMLKACEQFSEGHRFRISYQAAIRRMVSEICRLEPQRRIKALKKVQAFAATVGETKYTNKQLRRYDHLSEGGSSDDDKKVIKNGSVYLHMLKEEISDIDAACRFTARQIGDYRIPKSVKNYSLMKLLLTFRLEDFYIEQIVSDWRARLKWL